MASNSVDSTRASSVSCEWTILLRIRHESIEVKIRENTIASATEDKRRRSHGPATPDTSHQADTKRLSNE